MSEKPGGTAIHVRPGIGAALNDAYSYVRECATREDTLGYRFNQGLDKHQLPPNWMQSKDLTIAGSVLTEEEKGDSWYENRYKKEFMMAQAHMDARHEQDMLEKNDVFQVAQSIFKFLRLYDDSEKKKPLEERGRKLLREKIAKESEDKERRLMDWQTFLECLESDKPFLTVSRQYRNTFDAYGLDEFLDSSIAVLWMSLKIGCGIGLVHGSFRGLKAVHTDATFLKASGMGAMSFFNVSVIAGVSKWGGNMVGAAGMFILGDRAVTFCRRRASQGGASWRRWSRRWSVAKQTATSTTGSTTASPPQATASSPSGVAKAMASSQQKATMTTVNTREENVNSGGDEAPRHVDAHVEGAPVAIDSELKASLVQRQRTARTPVNYAVGLGLSFASVGIMPWWILNNVGVAVRMGISGFALGGCLGYSVGYGLNRLFALNLERLAFTPGQYTAYCALMQRERRRVDNEVARLVDEQRRLANTASYSLKN